MKKITYFLLNIVFVLSIICSVLLPFFYRLINAYWGYEGKTLYIFIVLVCLSGLVLACLLYNLIKIYKTFAEDNPFTMNNVKYLNHISLCCWGIALIYVLKTILIFSPASAVVALMFFCCGLLALSLRDLFIKAVEYKEENDLTI